MFRYWVVFVVLFYSAFSSATEIKDLYRAKAELLSQSQVDKDNAIHTAMGKVLVKIAGNRQLLSNPFIQKELQKHSRYMTQFNFSNEDGINKLVATFDKNKIRQLFVQHDIPFWGNLRPLTLFWVVNDDGRTRTIISETTDSSLQRIIAKAMEEKGLPTVLPLMDLTDTQNIEISDLWGRFKGPIYKASERYSPEKIVIVRITSLVNSSATPLKKLDWYMFDTNNNQIKTGDNLTGLNETEVLNKAVTNITETMAAKYALSTSSSNEMLIEVGGINNLPKFVEVSRFLDKLSAVSEVQLVKVEGEIRRFKLSFMGSEEALLTTLSLNNNLIPQERPEPLIIEQSLPEPLALEKLTPQGERQEFINVEQVVEANIPFFYWGNE